MDGSFSDDSHESSSSSGPRKSQAAEIRRVVGVQRYSAKGEQRGK